MCARTFAEQLIGGEADSSSSSVKPVHQNRRQLMKLSLKTPPPIPKPDTIAILTAYTKNVVDLAYSAAGLVQHTKTYTILTRTTQPAHALLFLGVLLVAWCLQTRPGLAPSPSAALLHLTCFATHFGAQLWMTFVSGLSLYFSLPRHQFGAVQRVLFPRYFALNSALSLGALFGFAFQCPARTWDSVHLLQGFILASCFLGQLAVRLYLTGPLVALISAKEAIERKAGVGYEVGRQEMGALVMCPHYNRLHNAFRRVHSGIAIANMTCLAASAVHLHFLAYRLTVAS